MSAWDNWIGRQLHQSDILTPAMLTRFRAALDSGAAGDIAAQAVHWCLCTPEAATADLGEDGHPRRSDSADSFLPPIPLPRRMWASSKVEFHAPISVGAAIERTSTVASITEKSGGSGPLVFVEIAHTTKADNVLAVSETQTVVYREASTAAPTPLGEGEVDLSGWQWHREIMPSETLLFRYSALTFNTHRIHYDAPYAVNEERYRGLVVHGPLTATLLLDLAQRELGANTLKSFAFRGQAPAFVGEALHLVGKQEGSEITLTALGSDGRMVMSANAMVQGMMA
jgi:3-methylfumaryl-CoA hydratase